MAQTEGVQEMASRRGGAIGFDFKDPRDARKFLREFRFPDGSAIELIRRKDGVVINVLVLDDFGVTDWASEIYRNYYMRGIGYVEPVDVH